MASMYCERSRNVGDEIQCIAAARLLPRVDTMVARERLGEVDEDVVVPMNGWFGPPVMSWPPSPSVRPIYFGFHVTDRHRSVERILADEHLDHLRAHAPVGCRDTRTRDLLRERGVDASTTWCATLTLPRRTHAPRNGKVFLVNTRFVPLPSRLRRIGVEIDQNVHASLRPSTQRAIAEDLLATYRDEARLVVTTKIHCAMPCAAMGIPTVFIGDRDNPRYEPVGRILPVNHFRHSGNPLVRRALRTDLNRAFTRSVDWDPAPAEYEDEKASAVAAFDAQLERALAR